MNDLLNQLPEYDPHPDLWARIDADLTSDERLARVVSELPQHEPKAGVWERIEERNLDFSPVLLVKDQTDIRVTYSPFTVVRPLWAELAVAAVVVLVSVWLFLRTGGEESVRVEYAVETGRSAVVDDVLAGDSPSGADRRAEAFIRQQCAEQTVACQRPEVQELRNQLTDLTAEQGRIEQERQTFGDDPRLVRAQVQIENQRADVTKELITLLRS